MSNSPFALVWFRDDLRLADNPALAHALESGLPVRCAYVHDAAPKAVRPLGGAAGWWLSRSLRALSAAIHELGGRLDVFSGDPEEVIPALAAQGASLVAWNRRYTVAEQEIDGRLKERLRAGGHAVASFNGRLLHEPWELEGAKGGPIRVFSAFWRAAQKRPSPAEPLPAPTQMVAAPASPAGPQPVAIDSLGLEPSAPDWAGGMREAWTPGEAGAHERLSEFFEAALDGYGENRNRPDLPGTSRLSPHLRFGEISVRQIWHAATFGVESGEVRSGRGDLDKFIAELGWREFSYHLLHHQPDLHWRNWNPAFDPFPFQENEKALKAWRRGLTGYPIVDAGMRELWTTGWMHNRVRMIVASFLCKHLLIDWRRGEEWFWDTLVDADPGNNAASWQWVAGSGADAAPYFRIFNPILQGEKFDPDGLYVRRWVPELAKLPASLIHKPWTAAPGELARFGIRLGATYPRPVIDHDLARDRALAAFEAMRAGTKPVA